MLSVRCSSGPSSTSRSQHRSGGRECERMAHERPCEERHTDLGKRFVPVAPQASVESIHVLAATRNQADRKTTADDLAVRRDVRSNPEERLGAALVSTETGHDLVEDQSRIRLLGDRRGLRGGIRRAVAPDAGSEPARRAPPRARLRALSGLRGTRGSRSRGRARSRPCSDGMPGAIGTERNCPSTLVGRTSTSSNTPWYAPANIAIVSRPLTVRATRIAAVTASEPVLQNATRSIPVNSETIRDTSPARGVCGPISKPCTQLRLDGLPDERWDCGRRG